MSGVRCARCGDRVLAKSDAGTRIFVQGPLTIGEDGVCRGKCSRCKEPVELPLELAKSYTTPRPERLVIVERLTVK